MPAAEASELEARAELDDAVWRDIEEVGRCTGVTRHEAEQALAPPHHRGRAGGQKSRAVDVPATGFALYGAMGLKPSDPSSAAASFIDGSVSNLTLAYTSPDRG